jgi:hypothetical protein
VVWYHPSISDVLTLNGNAPLAAIIVAVHSDSMVNLFVMDAEGRGVSRKSVFLVQDSHGAVPDSGYAEWMPYQVGQAAKTEELTKKLIAEKGV